MCACDFRFVTADSRLYLPEVNIQVPLTWGLTARLIRDIGRPKAMELITLCDDLPPAQAESLGLINGVAQSEAELEELVNTTANRLTGQNETTLHLVKTQFRALDHTVDSGDVTEMDNDMLLYRGLLDQQPKCRL